MPSTSAINSGKLCEAAIGVIRNLETAVCMMKMVIDMTYWYMFYGTNRLYITNSST
jgi:hypothetical protein